MGQIKVLFNVPKADSLVERGGEEGLCAVEEGERPHAALVALEGECALQSLQIP